MTSAEPSGVEPARWRKWNYLAYALALVCLAYVGFSMVRQTRVNALVSRLATGEWQQAKADLVALGERALPYTVRAFYYDLDPTVRRRAGQTLLESVSRLAQEAPKEETARSRWQEDMRVICESDMVTKALRDEDPEVRQLAAKVDATLGFEHGIEEGRYRRWKKMEELIDKVRQKPADKKHLEAIMQDWRVDEVVGEFGNSVLVGIMADDPDADMRKAATWMLGEMLETAYRADDREEMVKLVGHRRLRMMLKLLAEGVPGADRLLSFSPNIRAFPKLLPGIRDALCQAKAKGPEAYEQALTRWKDIYSDIEEGQKGVLRSKAVVAILGKTQE